LLPVVSSYERFTPSCSAQRRGRSAFDRVAERDVDDAVAEEVFARCASSR